MRECMPIPSEEIPEVKTCRMHPRHCWPAYERAIIALLDNIFIHAESTSVQYVKFSKVLDMRRLPTVISIAIIALGTHASNLSAEELPTFDVAKSCRTDTQAYSAGSNATACLADEKKAQETLVSQWTLFAPEDRTRCLRMVGDIAGSQSYVELLTCLELAKDVKALPKNE
jgi:hypothetical protein